MFLFRLISILLISVTFCTYLANIISFVRLGLFRYLINCYILFKYFKLVFLQLQLVKNFK